jgi:protoporphyrinogen/coproporphyrinogen III oxidase
MSTQVQALVIGAGISGLAAAYALQKSGIETLIIEAATRPGGVIQTAKREGFLLEYGPQSFSGNAAISTICKDLGIESELLRADPKAPRYILIDGKLRAVPMGAGLLASSFMAGGTRSALLRDVLGKSTPPADDESLANFVRRKFSSTLLDRLIGPFVSGIYAGDPEKLSARAAFPILHEAEALSGSVLRGVLRLRKTRKTQLAGAPTEKPTLQTFREGNETLILAIAAWLDERLRMNVEAVAIEPLDCGHEAKAPRFRVAVRSATTNQSIEAERLILAVPADVAARLLSSLDPSFSSPLEQIEYAGVAVVSLGYPLPDIGGSLNGFGFLVPRSSGLRILGTVWNSSLFPGRAPEGDALLTSFVGGATDHAAIQRSSAQLVELVHKDLAPILSIDKEPIFSNVKVWSHAIPQYNLGHTAHLAAIEKLRSRFPGLHLATNYLLGPSVGSCVEQAFKLANEIRVSFAN